jgi:hypothetical protein
MQIFNVINASTVLTETQTLGGTVKPFVAGGPRWDALGHLEPADDAAESRVQILAHSLNYGSLS